MTSITPNLGASQLQAEAASQDRVLRAAEREDLDRAEIRKVAEDFESLFLGMVLKSMRNTVQKSGLIDGGNAEEIYRSMLDDEYTKIMAQQRTTGLAGSIEAQLLQASGLSSAAATPAKAVAHKVYQGQGWTAPAIQATMDIGKGAPQAASKLEKSIGPSQALRPKAI